MLIEFSVSNYKSFKEEATLSMVAATRLTSQDPQLDANTVFPLNDNTSLLTSAAVYGANASGKSNLVAAMRFMREFVLYSSKESQAGEAIPIELYKLSPETLTEPATFEMVFIAEGTQYRYGFAVTKERVTSEWLFHTPKLKEVELFNRENGEITINKRAFPEGEGLQDKTRGNALFLSVVAQFNGSISTQTLRWFRRYSIVSGLQDDDIRMDTIIFLEEPRLSDKVMDFIRSLDIGITDIQVNANNQMVPPLPTTATPLSRSAPPSPITETPLPTETKPMTPLMSIFSLLKGNTPNIQSKKDDIKTYHKTFSATGEETSPVSFDLDTHESEGTKKIFALAGQIISTLNIGRPLIIDEFDARLHPLITREIVRLFNSPETNPKHAQLVFMTHDTNLLDKDFLRRDQIWFVEKDRYGASHLYSLAEFKVRNDASYGRDYIKGKYGAIPFLGDLRRVVEEANA